MAEITIKLDYLEKVLPPEYLNRFMAYLDDLEKGKFGFGEFTFIIIEGKIADVKDYRRYRK